MPFVLLKDHVSRDTVTALSELLQAAESGQINGIAFVASLRGRRFMTNSAGECYRDPTFTRGALLALDDELSHMVQNRARDTTI